MKKIASSSELLEGFKYTKRDDGLIAITNYLAYTMGEYNPRTGTTKWSRVVLAGSREKIEAWLRKQYPMPNAA